MLYFIVHPILLVFPHRFIRTVRCIYLSKIEWSIVGGNCSRSNSSGRCLSYALIRMNEKENTKNEIMVFYGFLVFGYNLWLNSLSFGSLYLLYTLSTWNAFIAFWHRLNILCRFFRSYSLCSAMCNEAHVFQGFLNMLLGCSLHQST